MHVGIHTTDIQTAISGARERLILSLGLYNDFFRQPGIEAAVRNCLGQVNFRQFHVLILPDRQREDWIDQLLDILRPHLQPAEQEHEIAASRDALVRLAASHLGQINIYELRSLICTPIIIADNKIFWSQFCASEVNIYQGLWHQTQAKVEKLMEYANSSRQDKINSPKELAAFRLIQDVTLAMKNAKRMLL